MAHHVGSRGIGQPRGWTITLRIKKAGIGIERRFFIALSSTITLCSLNAPLPGVASWACARWRWRGMIAANGEKRIVVSALLLATVDISSGRRIGSDGWQHRACIARSLYKGINV